jgi:hypothetical protein
MVGRLLLVVLAALAGCSYNAAFADCEVSCTQATGCPDSLTCGDEGLCREPGIEATCASIFSDAAKELSPFTFSPAYNNTAGLNVEVSGTITGSTIAVAVPFGTNVAMLTATWATTGVRVEVGDTPQVSSMTMNDFTTPLVYRVTAADGSSKDYDVEVTLASMGAKEITAYSFQAAKNAPKLATDVIATINGTAITATVPSGTDLSSLKATFSTTGVGVTASSGLQVSGVTPNNFTSAVPYTVTAYDGTTQSYVVTVTAAAPGAKEITDFAFLTANNAALTKDVTATINGTTISATLPYGTSRTSLKATFSTTGLGVTVGGVVQVSSMTVNNFSSALTYRVTATDGSIQDYTVYVTAPICFAPIQCY